MQSRRRCSGFWSALCWCSPTPIASSCARSAIVCWRRSSRPGRATRHAHVEIVRGRAGDFQVAAKINGSRVAMVLDTGASSVVLTQEAAKIAGLPIEVLTYTVSVETANGPPRAAPVTLDRLEVGDIVERAVPALIAQPGQLRTSLLGMSFSTG